MELAVPLVVLLHFHRMTSSSAAVVTITTAPTGIPIAENESIVSQTNPHQQKIMKLITYVCGDIISLWSWITKI